jgi:hypothetical protein
MIVISWDVGVIHLGYCVLEYSVDEKNNIEKFEILDWDEINLLENVRLELHCCEKLNAKKNETPANCSKNATYCLKTGNGTEHGFCKTHLKKSSNYWSPSDTKKLFKRVKTDKTCDYAKKDGTRCDKKTNFVLKQNGEKRYFCTTHYKSELGKKMREYSPQLIKNTIVQKYPTSELQLNLVKKLDTLIEHFAKLGVEEVIIENQPSQKNPKMKSIANTLFDYFMIRGYVDKLHNLDIKLVRFMCPSNKLKVDADNTIQVLKGNKNEGKKYKLTKLLGIKYTKQLLENSPENLECLNLHQKQDDMCDAYLQGRYYLQFIKFKKPGSKTAKKKSISNKKQKNTICL